MFQCSKHAEMYSLALETKDKAKISPKIELLLYVVNKSTYRCWHGRHEGINIWGCPDQLLKPTCEVFFLCHVI